jgi:hypothetical protein
VVLALAVVLELAANPLSLLLAAKQRSKMLSGAKRTNKVLLVVLQINPQQPLELLLLNLCLDKLPVLVTTITAHLLLVRHHLNQHNSRMHSTSELLQPVP